MFIVELKGGGLVSYLALYRKYRPNNFGDLVGQPEVVNIIKNEILSDRISHAYLFSGPRGTGKTSTAKIIARMINCSSISGDGVPCGKCDSCLNFDSSSDVVEIDAASNNGVDEIRELRDKVNLVPTFGRFKIYIIDEVHMLTTQAFNALLKTLEEPPSHVVFILATTEFYKIPSTVVSRCQKFQFLRFSNEDIVKRLTDIAVKESISVDNDVLFEIARLSDGGLRDAINMLDQLSSFKSDSLSIQDVYKLNGVISYVEFRNFLVYIHSNDIVHIIEFIEELNKRGKSIERFIEDFIAFVKDILIYKNTSSFYSGISEKEDAIIELSNLFSEDDLYHFIFSLNDISSKIKNSSFGKILLVVEFIKISNELFSKKNDFNISVANNDGRKIENSPLISENNDNVLDTSTLLKGGITDKLKKIRINNSFATASKDLKEHFLKQWNLVEDKMLKDLKYASIAGMMSDVKTLVVGEKNIIFLAQYDSLLDRLFSCIDVIEQLLYDVFKIEYKVVFLLEDEWNYEKEKYISNIKSGKKYTYITEGELEPSDSVVSSKNEDIDKVVSILGEDLVEYI